MRSVTMPVTCAGIIVPPFSSSHSAAWTRVVLIALSVIMTIMTTDKNFVIDLLSSALCRMLCLVLGNNKKEAVLRSPALCHIMRSINIIATAIRIGIPNIALPSLNLVML